MLQEQEKSGSPSDQAVAMETVSSQDDNSGVERATACESLQSTWLDLKNNLTLIPIVAQKLTISRSRT